MKTLVKIIFLCVVFCASFVNLHAYTYDTGLYFHAQKVPVKQRTSLLLDNGGSFALKNDFSLSFDMLLRANEADFGGVAYFLFDGKYPLRFMFVTDDDNVTYPAFIFKDAMTFFRVPLARDRWVSVNVSINSKKNALHFSYAGRDTTISVPLKDYKNVSISLGRVDKVVSDVVPMVLRNLQIRQDGRETRFWKLGKHNGDICYDELEHAKAVAVAPSWQIDNHLVWKRIFETSTAKNLKVAFDPVNAQFYIIYDDAIEMYDEHGFLRKNYKVKNNYPVLKHFPYCMYDIAGRKLMAYSMLTNRVARFSFESGVWSSRDESPLDATHYNHAVVFNPDDSSYYFFGGYGHYRYHNDLYRLVPSSQTLQRVNYGGKVIPPRFGASMGVVNNKLYILGGRGNRVGRQAIETYYYYDLWEIDLRTHKARLVWDGKDKFGMRGLMLSSSMIYNKKDGCFYVVNMDDEGGKLLKVSLKSPEITAVSHGIRNLEEYQDFNYSLYYSPTHSKLFLVVDKIKVDRSHRLSIYSINTPLLDEAGISQDVSGLGEGNWVMYVIGAFVLVSGTFLIVYFRKKRLVSVRKPIEQRKFKEEQEETREDSPDSEPKEEKSYFDRSRSAVSLLGGFYVRDKNGNDITSSFTPRLKDMFILLILYSEKDSKGISVNTLTETFWFDKDDSQARNNRNVTVRKLRVILQQVGDVRLISENGFMRIEWGSDVFCDYHAMQVCLKAFNSGGNGNDELFGKIQELMFYGPLLPDMSVEWLDDFKAKNSDESIDILLRMLEIEKEKGNKEAQLHIADIMFLHDPLSEEALALKCSVLFSQGKKGIAKNVYDRFCKEYKEMIAEDFNVPFSELEKNKR